jgi:hypothetical protein
VPNVARIYDYLLGGQDNYASDRQAAQELMRLVPEAAATARHNRGFLQRAVRFLATEAGVRQYIDIGAGLPTSGNVHEIAQRWRPDSHVLYVDNDAVVVSHAQALLADNSTAVVINRDVRIPRAIIDHPATQALINFDEPIAVLLVAILHFVSDDDDPHELVRQFIDVLPRGSYLVISHGTAEAMTPVAVRNVRQLYDRADTASAPRSRDNIVRFFAGCRLIEPGLVRAEAWRNGFAAAESDRIISYAGVGVKR